MAYTLDQVRCFVAVAEEGHFGRAADRLSMTQPPLSRQVQKLEQALGVTLLRRTPRGADLTVAGATFLEDARRLETLAARARDRARQAEAGEVGRIVLGYTAMAALNVLGAWVTAARESIPDVELDLRELPTSAQVEALLADELDLGLVRGRPVPDTLEGALVHRESLLLAAPAGHPLLGLGRKPRLDEVLREPMIGYSREGARYFHDLVLGVVAGAEGVAREPTVVQEAGQVNSVLALVAAGLGVALVPAAATRLATARVRWTTVDGVPAGCVELGWARRRGAVNPAVDRLLASVVELG